MRLGKVEKAILLTIKEFNQATPATRQQFTSYRGRHRYEGFTLVALLYVKNKVFHREGLRTTITPSNKASFSRALKSLEQKGLIKTQNKITDARYRTHVWLTEEGETLTLGNVITKLTSISSNGLVSRETRS